MRGSGNEGMATMMEHVGREDMIQMHNAIGEQHPATGDSTPTRVMMGGSL